MKIGDLVKYVPQQPWPRLTARGAGVVVAVILGMTDYYKVIWFGKGSEWSILEEKYLEAVNERTSDLTGR